MRKVIWIFAFIVFCGFVAVTGNSQDHGILGIPPIFDWLKVTSNAEVGGNLDIGGNVTVGGALQNTAKVHGATGATETFTLADGSAHSATVDEACTFTLSGWPSSGTQGKMTLYLTDDGDGNTITWPAAVNWPGGTTPTPTTGGLDIVICLSIDGGTTIHCATGAADSQ